MRCMLLYLVWQLRLKKIIMINNNFKIRRKKQVINEGDEGMTS